jgi:regulatory protein
LRLDKNCGGRLGISFFLAFLCQIIVEHKEKKIYVTLAEARLKIRSWCAYQERSQHETRKKLREWHVDTEIAEHLITELIGENYLNEERFAIAFAGGKFRIKHWGRNKIKSELKKHQISAYCMNKAMEQIEDEKYTAVLKHELEKKIRGIKSNDKRKLYYNTLQYLVSRGFETDLVRHELNTHFNTKDDEFRFEE